MDSIFAANTNFLSTNKNKIINDPIYGFISIGNPLIFDLLEHPYFQRLRRISQLGLSYLVYPGAYHTRFHHALGAMHLMQKAISVLRKKGQKITDEEAEAVSIAILLHDIGHGPFSHALESTLISGVSHEALSKQFMQELNKIFDGKLTLAIKIFSNDYHKKFLHQLIASQLDMDRLDYLRRDSFYTGVTEGAVNSERLISMLNVKDDQLVIDAKGIYSVEKFIVARRLMYWQVYLHKTVISAEFMLVHVLKRAQFLAQNGQPIFATSALQRFLSQKFTWQDFKNDPSLLRDFSALDDNDIVASIKEWCKSEDSILSSLSKRLIDRKLFKVKMSDEAFGENEIENLRQEIATAFSISAEDAAYFLIHERITNHAYNPNSNHINLLYKDGTLRDVSEAADQLNISALSNTVTKHFLCYPHELRKGDAAF